MRNNSKPPLRQRIYRALLHLLPFDFQREYGSEMEQVFQEESAGAEEERRRASQMSLWWRTTRGITWTAMREHIGNLYQDVWRSARTLAKSPGFTAATVAMLALGIGINAATFTIVNAALFAGFPGVQHSDRIVQITTNKGAVYYPDFEEWRTQAKSFNGVALVRGVFHTIEDDLSAPDTYFTMEVTPGTFRMLGVQPILGRDFSPSDQAAGAEPVVMLRYDLWLRRFGGNAAIVGQTVRLDGVRTRVIGIMPQDFSFPDDQKLWTPLIPTPAALRRDSFYAQYAYARMANGATLANARAEMETIGRNLANAYPRSNQGMTPVLNGFDVWYVGTSTATIFKTIWGAVVFVLLIICGNVANLLLLRAMGRSHEISIRLALGAGRWRIMRQFLIESLLLSAAGGLAGWWIAKAGVHLYSIAQVSSFTRVLGLTMDHQVLGYLITISAVTGVLVAAAAALYLTRLNIHGTSKADGRGLTAGKQGRRLSGLLVAAEMVFAVVLLASAAVIGHSFSNVYRADLGINPANVMTTGLYLPPERYPSAEARFAGFRNIEARLKALPGVESVGFAGSAPADSTGLYPYQLGDAPVVDAAARPSVAVMTVSTGYFRTLSASLIMGREFDDSDQASTMPIAIVNRQFAERHWPGQSALGQRLQLFGVQGQESTPWLTVVGEVSNIMQNDRTRQAFTPLVYLTRNQYPGTGFAFLRSNVPAGSLSAAVRREIHEFDPNLPLPVLMPLTERLARSYGFERNVTLLFLIFAAIALLLASIGLYATVSHSVSRRIREIGVRVAIGATGRDILALIFRQGILPVGSGLAIGLVLSFAVTRFLKSQLVGVSPADPLALLIASAVLILSAALGCWLPARRAMRVDPVVALRHD